MKYIFLNRCTVCLCLLFLCMGGVSLAVANPISEEKNSSSLVYADASQGQDTYGGSVFDETSPKESTSSPSPSKRSPTGGVLPVLLLLFAGYFLYKRMSGPGNRGQDRENRTNFPVDRKSTSSNPEPRDTSKNSSSLGENSEDMPDVPEVQKRAAAMWGSLSSQTEDSAASGAVRKHNSDEFDEKDFLEGAKMLYTRLQNSWAERDLDDLKPFTTDSMMQVLQKQAEKLPNPSSMNVLLVTAKLLSVERSGNEETCRVLFSSLLQEGQAAPYDTKEIWSFTHDFVKQGTWLLASIAPAGENS